MYRTAWLLFVVALVIPAFPAGGLYPSGPFAAAKAVLWTDGFSQGRPDPSFPVLALFGLALFTNLLFASAPFVRKRGTASRTATVLWIAAIAINVATALVLPVFLATLGYWVWLGAFVTMAWALLALPEATPVVAPRSDVPPFIWIGLAWFAFWLGVTAAHHYQLDEGLQRAALADTRAEGATTLTHHFNDPDKLVGAADAVRFEQALARLDRETSTQVAVAIYGDAPADALEEFTIHTAELSRLGMKGLDNGVILFLFVKPRLARLEVGYGLEGILTDADAHRILEERAAPAFDAGDYSRGLDDALAEITRRVQEAYKSGKTPGEATILYRQLKAELPKVARRAWPAINEIDTGSRLGLSFFATLLLGVVLNGFYQLLRWFRAAGTAAENLHLDRPPGRGIGKLQWAPIFDALKILILIGIPIAAGVATVVIAGGGTFGGAGATLRW